MTITQIKDDAHWHKLRKQTIGASECGIIFGSSPYGTLNELYHVKKGNFNPNFESKLMAWGQAMEPVIANFISSENYWDLKHCRDYHQHPDHPHLGATLDYYVVQSEHGAGILEIKNVSTFSPDWTSNRAPAHVELQLQHQFLVVNAARKAAGLEVFNWGCIGSMHSGNPEDIRIMHRKPDPEIHEHIIKKCGEFWSDVQAGNEPDLVGHKEYDHLAEMFKYADAVEDEPELIDCGDDAILDSLIAKHEEAKFQKSKADHEQKDAKARILRHLMLIDDEGLVKKASARTNNYAVQTKVIEINYKPRPAKNSTQLRFTIREVSS